MDDALSKGRPERQEEWALDAHAVRSTLGGNVSAYDELIERYQRRAVSVSYRLLGNIEDAMDVCQDAFVRSFKSLATLQSPERFGPWLLRIVTNLSLNFRRGRRQTLRLTSGDEQGGIDEDQATEIRRGSSGEEEDLLEKAETHAALNAAIETLPEQQRLALVLFAIEQLPQKEVAEIMECSVEMVKWNVFQARKALKEKLAEYMKE